MWLPLGLCLVAVPAQVLRFPPQPPARDLNDADLVVAAARGEHFAQHQLYQRHVGPVYGCVARLLGRGAEAEDVVQDSFVAAFSDLPKLTDTARFGPWLRSIAVHQVHRRLRRRRMLRRLGLERGHDDVTLAGAVDPGADPYVNTMLRELDVVLARLVPVQRLAWMLRHVEGHSLDEVAEQCGVSLATVKRHITKAEACLRRHLDFDQPPQDEG